jgi:CheY-like chemotaxis protein
VAEVGGFAAVSNVEAASSGALSGKRVLVIEDETLVAMLVEDLLDELGCTVAATFSRVSQAQDFLAKSTDFDAAILDVNIAGEDVYSIATALSTKDIPFVFVTGYGPAGVKEEWRERGVVQKPIQQSELAQLLEAALAKRKVKKEK